MQSMRYDARSEYLQWTQTRKTAKFNLAVSGILPCPLIELGARIEDLEINGPSMYGFAPLQQAIAAHCDVPVECVVAASGTTMANFVAMAAVIEPGAEVLIEQPAYDPLIGIARYLGAEVKRFQRASGFSSNLISSRTKLIILTNLHNPTCARLEEAELRNIGNLAKDVGALVMVDEVYLECMFEEMSSAFHHGPQFVCTSSLTKAYGLSGLRCGWILAEPQLARRIRHVKDLMDTHPPHPAEQLSVIAFRKLDHLAMRAKTLLSANRMLVREFVDSCPHIEVDLPEYGTCIFPRLKSRDADGFFELVHNKYDTDVVPGRFFERPDHFRMGIGADTATLKEGLQRLKHALEFLSETPLLS
jgi:aspartate/methionine/tyrosine aminotransferase